MKRSAWCAFVGIGSVVTGCFVPENQYDQAVHTLRAEQAAHRETAEQLYEIRQKLEYANGVLEKEHSELSSQETEIAQSKLDLQRMAAERQDASQTVEQLRGELARVGDHLRAFSEQKNNLQTALDEAEEKANELERLEREAELRGLLMRDLTYALHEEVSGKSAAISTEGGDPRVRIDTAHLFEGTKLTPGGAMTARRLASAVGLVARARVEVTEHPDGTFRAEDIVVRLQSFADALAESGVGFERVTLSLPEERAEGEGATEGPTAGESASATEPEAKGATSFVDGPGSVEVAIVVTPEEER